MLAEIVDRARFFQSPLMTQSGHEPQSSLEGRVTLVSPLPIYSGPADCCAVFENSNVSTKRAPVWLSRERTARSAEVDVHRLDTHEPMLCGSEFHAATVDEAGE